MHTLHCTICNVKLGLADQLTIIRCPSCVEFAERMHDYIEGIWYDATDGFIGVDWLHGVETEVRKNNRLILAMARQGGFYLADDPLNEPEPEPVEVPRDNPFRRLLEKRREL